VKEGSFAAAIVQLGSAVTLAGFSEDEKARLALQASTTPSILTPLPTPATAAPPPAPVINMDMSEPGDAHARRSKSASRRLRNYVKINTRDPSKTNRNEYFYLYLK
jgi:hypothetical protein